MINQLYILENLNLINFKNISHSDLSNLNLYLINFVQHNNIDEELIKEITSYVYKDVSDELKSLCINLLAYLHININVCSLLDNDSPIHSLIYYVTQKSINICDFKIYNFILTKNIVYDETIGNFFKERIKLASDFMKLIDEEFLIIQLELISIIPNLTFDENRFLKFLGSDNKFIAFKTSETFYLRSLLVNKKVCLNINLINEVKSQLHFIKYGCCFLEEKDKKLILKLKDIKVIKHTKNIQPPEKIDISELNFNFIFINENSNLCISDCPEF
ncbi:hypothetical protein A0H76_2765 [Hepatospora eriocheir]|uniref:Uncharacterized protein n=1 Tax=Hepatospora eriocheir TaxID=1081669 RepID=A0A1X0QF72_9MICR|nr:hypothetical protein A0H76_2765 [Hepatospora eriocheir]